MGAVNNMAAIEREVNEHVDELLAIAKAPRDLLALQLRRLQVWGWRGGGGTERFGLTPNLLTYPFPPQMCFDIYMEAQERRSGSGTFKGKLFANETMLGGVLLYYPPPAAAQLLLPPSTPDQVLPFCWNADKQLFEHR